MTISAVKQNFWLSAYPCGVSMRYILPAPFAYSNTSVTSTCWLSIRSSCKLLRSTCRFIRLASHPPGLAATHTLPLDMGEGRGGGAEPALRVTAFVHQIKVAWDECLPVGRFGKPPPNIRKRVRELTYPQNAGSFRTIWSGRARSESLLINTAVS